MGNRIVRFLCHARGFQKFMNTILPSAWNGRCTIIVPLFALLPVLWTR